MANAWPAVESFDAGASPYGTHPNRYIRFRPHGASESYSGVGVSNFGPISAHHGMLFARNATNRASTHAGPGFVGTDVVVSVVERSIYQADGEAYLDASLVTISGAPSPDSVRGIFVWARVTGGTLTVPGANPQYTEFYEEPDGIFFADVKLPGGARRLILGYCSSGAVSILGNVPLSNFETAPVSSTVPIRRMRIVCSGTTVTAYRAAPGGTSPMFDPVLGATEDEVFSIASGSWPSAAGRWGFGMQVFKTDAFGWQGGVDASTFVVRDDTGATIFRDEFRRALPSASRVETDQTGAFGHSLMQAWTGDGAGLTNTLPSVGHLARSSSLITMGVDTSALYGTVGQFYGWHIWQSPAASAQQRRSVVMTLTGPDPVEGGIFLRGSFLLVPPFGYPDLKSRANIGSAALDYRKGGYLAAVEYDGADFLLRILHYEPNTSIGYVPTTIATADLGAAGVSSGVSFVLDFEARNFGPDVFGSSAFVALRVKINSAVITTTAEIPEILIVDDWVLDIRTVATSSGVCEGVFFRSSAYGTGRLIFDSWTAETLSDPPAPSGGSQATIPSYPETEGATGTLEVSVSWDIELLIADSVLRFETEHGRMMTSPRYSAEAERYRFTAPALPRAERVAFEEFFAAHGYAVPFNWTNPLTGEAVVARFVGGEFGFSTDAIGAGTDSYDTLEFVLEVLRGEVIFNPDGA